MSSGSFADLLSMIFVKVSASDPVQFSFREEVTQAEQRLLEFKFWMCYWTPCASTPLRDAFVPSLVRRHVFGRSENFRRGAPHDMDEGAATGYGRLRGRYQLGLPKRMDQRYHPASAFAVPAAGCEHEWKWACQSNRFLRLPGIRGRVET